MDHRYDRFYFEYSANGAYRGSPNPPYNGYGFYILFSKLVLIPNFTNRLRKGLIQRPTLTHQWHQSYDKKTTIFLSFFK